MNTDRSATLTWSFRRGMRGAMIWGMSVWLALAILSAAIIFKSWWTDYVKELDRQEDIERYVMMLVIAGVGSFVVGCAAFAAWAPEKGLGIAKCLGIVVFATVVLWTIVGSMPMQLKSIHHPIPGSIRLAAVFIVPASVGLILSRWRRDPSER